MIPKKLAPQLNREQRRHPFREVDVSKINHNYPECSFPWCTRRVYDKDDRGLCRVHADIWGFNIWQAFVMAKEREAANEPKTTDNLALAGRDF